LKHDQTPAMDSLMPAFLNAEALQALFAETNYRLRESRKAVLQRYAVQSEAELLAKIEQGCVAEHPAYELYLSALILEQTRMQIRAELVPQLDPANEGDLPSISVHLGLKEKLQTHYASRLMEPVQLAQDALMFSFDTGLKVEVRYFSRQEYSISWLWNGSELRIDTAPTHVDCSTRPHHLHRKDGTLAPDNATLPGTDCWLNLSGLLDRLLSDPLLSTPSFPKNAATYCAATTGSLSRSTAPIE
jgi:hypothetical protein